MGEKRSARSFGVDNMVMSHFTLARNHPIDERVSAAAAAGFDGIGFYLGDFLRLGAEGFDIEQLADLLDEHAMVLAEIEVVQGWAHPERRSELDEAFEQAAWQLADRFECRYLQAIGPYDGTSAEAGEQFGLLCDRAGDHGLVVGLEFLPFTNIVDAADALRIVEAADRPNGGLCVDIWHHVRGANRVELLEAIPAERVMGIQMNDGTLVPAMDDYKADCLHHRVAPGSGEFDVDGFIGLLLDKGVTVPWSVEVCQQATWGQPGAEHVARCAEGMRAALDRASMSRRGQY